MGKQLAPESPAVEALAPPSLWRNRDFNLLWSGQVLSSLGGGAASVALPLLVLALTGSPAKAGIAGFVEMLPLPLLGLPAGVFVDRVDRRRVMLVADGVRFVAVGSLPVALWLGHLGFPQILAVSFVSGSAWVLFWISENAALRRIVPEAQLPDAVALNQARQYGASLAGPPLGGFLFNLGRSLPFVADSVSYLASFLALLLVRTRLQEELATRRARPLAEVREGLTWLWRQPFLRAVSLLVTGSDFVLNALYLVLIVAAKEQGASSTTIGIMLGIVGGAGVLGSLVAPRLARRLSLRAVVVGVECLTAALVPLLILAPNAYLLGVIFGATLAAWPLWNAAVRTYQMSITPDALQGRIQSVTLLLSNGAVPLATLLAGFLLEFFGSDATILVFSGILVIVAAAAVASPAIRQAPTPARR